MEILPILVVICIAAVIVIVLVKQHKAAQEQALTSVPEPEKLYVPDVFPMPGPAPVVENTIVIFEDTYRSVRVCPQCDGENIMSAKRCSICDSWLV